MQVSDNNKCFFKEVFGQNFPVELTRHIFSFLDPISLILGASKCDRTFHAIAKDPSLQQNFLPQEIMLHIFSFLDKTKDLVSASLYDKAHYEAVDKSAIWFKFMSQRFYSNSLPPVYSKLALRINTCIGLK